MRVDYGKKRAKFFTKDDGAIKLHPGSVNAMQPGALMHKYVGVDGGSGSRGGYVACDAREPANSNRCLYLYQYARRWLMHFEKMKTVGGLFVYGGWGGVVSDVFRVSGVWGRWC